MSASLASVLGYPEIRNMAQLVLRLSADIEHRKNTLSQLHKRAVTAEKKVITLEFSLNRKNVEANEAKNKYESVKRYVQQRNGDATWKEIEFHLEHRA